MMTYSLIGRFYFKKTSNGNLIGEFSNYIADDIFTESCDLIGTANGYLGDYYSTWRDKRDPVFADLKISQRNNKLFSLIWKNKGTTIFEGEGMLCDSVLIEVDPIL